MAEVMTATGPTDSSALGTTLMHEHLFVNLMREYRATGLLNDPHVMREEIDAFREVGGGTIVDVTPAELTRGASIDPMAQFHEGDADDARWASRSPGNLRALRDIAEATGINVVIGTGHYRDPYLGEWIDEHSTDAIAEQLIGDITEGMSGTGTRAGIIGEIGADKWFVSAREERSFRAAARAQRRTNLAVTTHAARWPVGVAQLDLLAEEGVDPRRVVIGHCDSVPIPEYHDEIARRGAFVQYDLIRNESPRQTQAAVDLVVGMIRRGHLEHLLLSHDVCTASQLSANGGSGFSFVPSAFAQALGAAGVSSEEIRILLVDNPRRALAGD